MSLGDSEVFTDAYFAENRRQAFDKAAKDESRPDSSRRRRTALLLSRYPLQKVNDGNRAEQAEEQREELPHRG